MIKLSEMPNIGSIMEKRLAAVGVCDDQTLISMGSKETFKRLYLLEGDTCLNTLYALQGAIEGIRWHYLSSETKSDLKCFYDSFK